MSVIQKEWPEVYLALAIAAEIELAKAGRRYASFDAPIAPTRTAPVRGQFRSRLKIAEHLPRWRRDWNAAGELVTEFNLSIRQDEEEGSVSVGVRGRRLDVTERYEDHPDKAGAILAAIVEISTQLRAEQLDNAAERRRRF